MNESAERLHHLLNQIRWVTRNSVALSSAAELEDVYSILCAALVSPFGPCFSRVLLFEIEPDREGVVGRFSIGYDSIEEMQQLAKELASELRYLDQSHRDPTDTLEESDPLHEQMRNLEQAAPWLTVFQRLGTDSPASAMISHFRIGLRAGRLRRGEGPLPLFDYAMRLHNPRLFRRGDQSLLCPDAIDDLLADEFAMVPFRTKRGTQALMLVDREVEGQRISSEDLETLEWFATQGSLALQNAELIRDLEGAYEELKAVDQLKSNFLSIISHELRTPLTAISGFVDLLITGKVGEISEAQKGILVRVAKNTGHLSNMVNDIIEISEIKAEGISDVVLCPVDPLQTLFSTLPRLEYRRRDKKVDIDPRFEGSVPAIICDQLALERIYFHLLDNAVKFSPKGDEVLVRFQREKNDRLAITIEDHGRGIPAEKLQRIFDEFYQVDNSLTRAHEGLGLGLAVTKILVQATRGEIRVVSEEGEGSSFTLIYPIAKH